MRKSTAKEEGDKGRSEEQKVEKASATAGASKSYTSATGLSTSQEDRSEDKKVGV